MNKTARDALILAGWHEGRSVDAGQWIGPLESEGFIINDRAREVLSEFGGLTINPLVNGKGGSLFLDPYDAASGLSDQARLISEEYGEIFTPIGMWGEQYITYIGTADRVLTFGPGLDWELGTSFEDAVNNVADGRADLPLAKERFRSK